MVVVEELDVPAKNPSRGESATCQPVSSSFSRISSRTSSSRTPSPGARSDSLASRQSPRMNTPPVACSSAATLVSPCGKAEQTPGRQDFDISLNVLQRLEAFANDITQLRRAQEQWSKKQDDAEVFRRGRFDSLSDRIFQVEKKLRKTEEEQQDAIDKASLTFQKSFQEVQQDRQNMLAAINQVNQNFERVSLDMNEQRVSTGALKQDICQLQQNFEWLSNDCQTKTMSVTAMQHSLTSMEIALKGQEQQLHELQAAAKAMRDTVTQTTPKSSSEERHKRLAEKFAEVHSHVSTLAAQMSKVDIDLQISPTIETRPQEVVVEVLQAQPSPSAVESLRDPLQASLGKQATSLCPSLLLDGAEVGGAAGVRVSPPAPPPVSLRAEVAVDVEAPGGAISPMSQMSASAATAFALSKRSSLSSSQEPHARTAACSPPVSLTRSCRRSSQRVPDGPEATNWEPAVSGTGSDDAGTLRLQPSGAQTAPIPGMPFLSSAPLSSSRTRTGTPVRGPANRGSSPPQTAPVVTRGTPAGTFRVVDAPLAPSHSVENDHLASAWSSRSAGRGNAHANALINGNQDWSNTQVGAAGFDRAHVQSGGHFAGWQGSVQLPARGNCHGQMPSAATLAHSFGPIPSSNQSGGSVGIGMVQRCGPVRTRSLSAAMRT